MLSASLPEAQASKKPALIEAVLSPWPGKLWQPGMFPLQLEPRGRTWMISMAGGRDAV